jgi:chemotaxis protein MotB
MSKAHSSRRKGPAGHEEEVENHERWLVSYADMMTLLFVTFVVMFAISQVDEQKFAELSGGLSNAFGTPVKLLSSGTGVLSEPGVVAPQAPNLAADVKARPEANGRADTKAAERARQAAAAAVAREAEDLRKARDAMLRALRKQGLQNAVRIRVDQRGLVVNIVTDKVLFAADRAELQPAGTRVLTALAPALTKLPNNVSVEGHTNTVPVKPRFYASEWELSSARAVSVLRYLVEDRGVPARRTSATGWADQHPLYPDGHPRANDLNRRVEIVVLSRVKDQAAKLLADTTPGITH